MRFVLIGAINLLFIMVVIFGSAFLTGLVKSLVCSLKGKREKGKNN
jgi:hypothetical protein